MDDVGAVREPPSYAIPEGPLTSGPYAEIEMQLDLN